MPPTNKRGKSGPASVPAAPDPTPTPEPRENDPAARPKNTPLPRFTEAEQKAITEFLIAYGMVAAKAADKLRELEKHAPDNPLTAGTRKYWENAVSFIDWLLPKVGQRQRAVQDLRDHLARQEGA